MAANTTTAPAAGVVASGLADQWEMAASLRVLLALDADRLADFISEMEPLTRNPDSTDEGRWLATRLMALAIAVRDGR